MKTLVFETALGHTALVRQEELVLSLTFGHSSERAALRALSQTLACDPQVQCVGLGEDELVDRICAFARGEACEFDDLQVDASNLTPFGRKVTAACRRIPWGDTLTYGELAKLAGRPGAARAVGSVMARNRVPLIVPCHRVLPAAGGFGGYSAPQGVAMKQRLLELEQHSESLLAL